MLGFSYDVQPYTFYLKMLMHEKVHYMTFSVLNPKMELSRAISVVFAQLLGLTYVSLCGKFCKEALGALLICGSST